MKAHLVVIGAHPLDAEILGGAIAARLSDRGYGSVLVHLTNGARSYPYLPPEESAHVSRREADQAARILGTCYHWCDFDSRTLRADGECGDALAERLAEWQPDLVITHWRGSWHERHCIAHHLVRNALAAAQISPDLCFGENFEDLAGFTPTHYVDISRVCRRWWKALESYELVRASRTIPPDDLRTFPYYAYYHAAPRVRGLESGLPLAQALASGERTRKAVFVDDLPDDLA